MEQFSIYCESNQGFFLLCFTSLCDWLRKLATLSRPNRFNTTTNGELVTLFSRALGNLLVFILSSHEMFSFLLIGCCQYFGSNFHNTQSQSAPIQSVEKCPLLGKHACTKKI